MNQAARILTPKERRERNRTEMIENILTAARDVMRKDGVAALNMQEIARAVGMRAPSLYNYFPSKTAIYETLFERGMRAYHEQFEKIAAEYGASWECLQRSFEWHYTFALENPELFQLLFERPVPHFVPSPAGLEEGQKLLASGRRLTEAVISSGLFQSTYPPEALQNFLIALMHGLVAQHLANEPQLPLGSGRFGSLTPLVIDVLQKAWGSAVERP